MNSQAIAPSKRSATKAQSRFQRLWEEAETAAQNNDRLNSELDALVQRIGIDVGEAESALADTVRQAVHRQLDFAEKKSLLKWQRAELSEWIDEHLNQLMDMGQLDEALRNRMAILGARDLDVELDENSELSPVEQLRAYMDQQVADEHEQIYGKDDDGFDEDGDEEELAELLRQLHEEYGEDDDAPPEPELSATKPKMTFDETVFKRLFRQTAAALHPDKESDPDRQSEKHELMSELLRARKERDLITIVRLHEQHASADSALSAKDEQQLEEVLVTYLNQQRERMDDIVHRSPMHQWVFQDFYHQNPATVTRRIKAHIKKIDTRREGLDIFVTRVKTLKMLKELLADRYDRHQFGSGWF